MVGLNKVGSVPVPVWASRLQNYYWIIRVEGRNKAKRRKYYRLVEKEKLRLAEEGYDQLVIIAICRYLSNLKQSNADRVAELTVQYCRTITI